MPTPYDPDNAEFSKEAHKMAREIIYPDLFGLPPERLSYKYVLETMDKKGETLDREFGIDTRVIAIGYPNFLKQPIIFTVQERFRKPTFKTFGDVAITEWNHRTNVPSELYKIAANVFIYGYFNIKDSLFIDVTAFDVQKTLILLCNKQLQYSLGRNPRSDQSFVAIKKSDLEKFGCIYKEWPGITTHSRP